MMLHIPVTVIWKLLVASNIIFYHLSVLSFANVYVCSKNCEKRLLGAICLSARLSVCMEHLGSRWTDFREI
jgi:hypothetical protein